LWNQIPEAPLVTTEGFSTEDEQATSSSYLPEWMARTIAALQEALIQHGSNKVFLHQEIVSCWLLLAEDLKKIEAKAKLLEQLVGQPGGLPTIDLWSSVRHLYQGSPAMSAGLSHDTSLTP
jgi:hypothetical protein